MGNFMLDPRTQYLTTILSAIGFAALVFSGFLLFRYSDTEDLLSRGKQLMTEGKVAYAAKTFQMLVNRDDRNYEGHLLLGQAMLELGDRRKAELEFRRASALQDASRPDAAGVALSKLALARKDFVEAERLLIKAYQSAPQDSAIQQALFDLYDFWGDELSRETTDSAKIVQAIRCYDRALRYVRDFETEEGVKDKLVKLLGEEAQRKALAKQYDPAVTLYQASLKYRYSPGTLIKIAETYEQAKRLDDAIAWFRKAFDANPASISLKLANILTRKAQELQMQGKSAEADKYLAEAKKVSQVAQMPPEVLYPVALKDVALVPKDFDKVTGEFTPTLKLRLENTGSRPVTFLILKAEFFSGSKSLGTASQVVVTPAQPLEALGNGDKSARTVELVSHDAMNVQMVDNRLLRTRVSIAYNEDQTPNWQVKAIQETTLPGLAPVGLPASSEGEENGSAAGNNPPAPPPPPTPPPAR
jgi:Flp pilus assembly protein TadD